MSIDDTALIVWQMERPPLGMLVAAKASELIGSQLSDEIRAPFLALSQALLDWWPKRERDPEDIAETEYRACLDLFADKQEPKKVQPLLKSASIQMAGLLRVAPMSLPAGNHYEVDEKDFQVLLRDAAKAGKLPVAQLESRLKLLHENYRDPWHKLLTRANKMRWTRSAPWTKLDKRLRTLAALADLGATPSWDDVGGRKALRLELDGTKRVAILSEEELETLRKVIPGIPDTQS